MMAEEFETPIRNTCVGTVFGMMSLIPGILLVVVLPSLLKFAGLVGSVFSVVLIAEVISGISCIMLVSDGRRKIFH
ncbi:hypothetical protein [Sulfuracidifex metallicus]|uniref:Uncharacterized protein n=1 Tax=Sulfuracidifex metallicus DSM 6482 = JCM 9184 TaxID=523847 RepID=A0A6A9QL97_SULME|nr:hypothetical protein [Sulfuracidifex metallicus]MUN29766.1 hypothetical protein [Sulfuracidifex metallicus DSM 6482 = JCM 9184]WOE51853.1 hypothetical protein RQ359_001194 [Sulfuracidifex metallicus DSM 6482 = JCM 9184]